MIAAVKCTLMAGISFTLVPTIACRQEPVAASRSTDSRRRCKSSPCNRTKWIQVGGTEPGRIC